MDEFQTYQLVKALHLIAMTAWMAGMFYLPRLYVYHSGVAAGSETSELFKLMEHRLLRIIINPAMIATWVFGLTLLHLGNGILALGWFHAKLSLLVIMQLVHAFLASSRRKFARDERPYSAKIYRIINEIPTVLLVGIILLAILKPF